jgi:hypothetical protein
LELEEIEILQPDLGAKTRIDKTTKNKRKLDIFLQPTSRFYK